MVNRTAPIIPGRFPASRETLLTDHGGAPQPSVKDAHALSKSLKEPLVLGGRTISCRLMPAPMTYVGNVAQRALMDHFGYDGLLFSEMCSAARIPHERRETSCYFTWRDEERHRLVVQILGNDPVKMAKAALRVQSEGLFGVDINMGCSAKTVCATGGGAALLKDVAAATAVIRAVRDAITIPVMVKFRSGWQGSCDQSVEMARAFEAIGVDALTFHPRMAPDRRTRPPKWDHIEKVKASVSIPVFGNGNVFSRSDCWRMLTSTGCDGVSIGRMAIAKPWVLAAWTKGQRVDSGVYAEAAHKLCSFLERFFSEVQAMRRFRSMAAYFCASFRFGHGLYARVLKAKSMREIREIMTAFFRQPPDLSSSPNPNLFR